ncbi:MAG: site-specific DNA-methyltransferase [Pirellulales bacterium]|nr:site-specific DNA-methyltransferase [Pirellulales bacterium]
MGATSKRLEPNRVHQGDCARMLAQIEPGRVDLVFADPPFNIGYDYDLYNDRRSREEYLDWSKAWMAGVKRALKPDGTFWLAIGDEYAAELKLIAQDALGFACRGWVIWYYTFGVNCVRAFSRSHTHLFHFVKDPDKYTFNAENPAVRVPSARQLVYADRRANAKCRLPDNTWILRPQDAPAGGFATMHDTWYFARVAGTFKEREGFHGCQMPEQLLGRIIRISSRPQELVLDPFAGSGTTLAVAKKLGRRWLGFELSKDYVKRINERLAQTRVGAPLDGPADPVRSAPKTAAGKRRVRMRNGRPVPHLDEQTQRGIVDAYRDACIGCSTDYVLCDPELNAAFVAACHKKDLRGDAELWNRLLLRIRKAGKLPRMEQTRRRLTFEEMDPYSFASEIAMQMVGVTYGYTLDEILCNPLAAAEFDDLAAQFAPGFSPFEYRWAALSIRKRARQSRRLARERFADWLKKRLPAAVPLEKCLTSKYEGPGVYVLLNSGHDLYVGETLDFKRRIERVADAECWTAYAPRAVRFISINDKFNEQHGLQSLLVDRVRPLLNSPLLGSDGERSPSHLGEK